MESIGYHGTTRRAAFDIYKNGLREKGYKGPHWLGKGMYFFQDAPLRAAAWANFKSEIRNGDRPVVLKVFIKSDSVIDFLDIEYWSVFREVIAKSSYNPTPQLPLEKLMQERSYLEQQLLYKNYEDEYYVSVLADYYDRQREVMAIRAAFVEGRPVFRTSWLLDEAHVQICVRSSAAIERMDWYSVTAEGVYTLLTDKEIERFGT